jgi:mannose-6-phosphate isomerase-like protein (cupin superfamily)
MKYKLTKYTDVSKKDKFGIHLDVYPSMENCEIVLAETETGHNQEFYNKKSSCNYLVIDGAGSFFLDDEEVPVQRGDFVQVFPNTRIYYKGKMKLVLITTPPWQPEDEVETKPSIW